MREIRTSGAMSGSSGNAVWQLSLRYLSKHEDGFRRVAQGIKCASFILGRDQNRFRVQAKTGLPFLSRLVGDLHDVKQRFGFDAGGVKRCNDICSTFASALNGSKGGFGALRSFVCSPHSAIGLFPSSRPLCEALSAFFCSHA